METGKTGKYFKYAIGEIVLVMVGILLALQVNNWNEGRKDNQQRIILLGNLKSEYLINLEEVENRIKIVDTTLSRAKSLISLMTPDYETLDVNQVDTYVGSVCSFFTTYDESSGALQDMISNNKLGLIREDSLRISLASWKQKVDNVKDREARCLNLLQNHLMPYLYKNYATLRIDNYVVSKLPFDNRSIMDDVQFETIVDDYRWNLGILSNQYKIMHNELVRILKLIKKELNIMD